MKEEEEEIEFSAEFEELLKQACEDYIKEENERMEEELKEIENQFEPSAEFEERMQKFFKDLRSGKIKINK